MHESIVFCTACRPLQCRRRKDYRIGPPTVGLISWRSNTVVLPRCKESSRSLCLISWWVSCYLNQRWQSWQPQQTWSGKPRGSVKETAEWYRTVNFGIQTFGGDVERHRLRGYFFSAATTAVESSDPNCSDLHRLHVIVITRLMEWMNADVTGREYECEVPLRHFPSDILPPGNHHWNVKYFLTISII